MYQNQFQKYDPTPFQELDIEPAVVSDDGPLMAPGLCRATLQRSIGKLFFHAGFEEFQPSAMEAMTDTASMFFTNLAQTVAMYTESSKLKQAEDNNSAEPGYQARFNVEETMLHALDENGLDVEGLDLYVKDDMERQSTKLAVMHERMKAHLAELLVRFLLRLLKDVLTMPAPRARSKCRWRRWSWCFQRRQRAVPRRRFCRRYWRGLLWLQRTWSRPRIWPRLSLCAATSLAKQDA